MPELPASYPESDEDEPQVQAPERPMSSKIRVLSATTDAPMTSC